MHLLSFCHWNTNVKPTVPFNTFKRWSTVTDESTWRLLLCQFEFTGWVQIQTLFTIWQLSYCKFCAYTHQVNSIFTIDSTIRTDSCFVGIIPLASCVEAQCPVHLTVWDSCVQSWKKLTSERSGVYFVTFIMV